MTDYESSDNSYDHIDSELDALLSGKSTEKFGNIIVESLSNEREALIGCLVDHLAAGDVHEVQDIDEVIVLQDQLSTLISLDLNNYPRLKLGDEVAASGQTMFILVEDEGDRILKRALNLNDDVCIRGLVSGIKVHDIPPLQIFDHNKRKGSDDGYRAPDENPAVYPFGLSLVLARAIHEDVYGHSENIPDDIQVLIPLNYPSLKLDRVVKQETN